MKYLFALFAALAIAGAAGAQQTKEIKAKYSSIPPYQRDSVMPNFLLLREDSTWLQAKNLPAEHPIVFVYFFPDCPHCQHEADSLVAYMDMMKDYTFVFTSYPPTFQQMDSFATHFGLAKFKNVYFTKDPNYQFGSFFRIEFAPFVALYKHGRLVKTWVHNAPPREIIDAAKE